MIHSGSMHPEVACRGAAEISAFLHKDHSQKLQFATRQACYMLLLHSQQQTINHSQQLRAAANLERGHLRVRCN
jgi:hypothetical protein